MKINNLEDLPPPPAHTLALGFPWTEYTPIQNNTENLPKLSIITPSYNQGCYIEETIRSVLLQNYPNLEYIIIDGGSTDGTVEIIKKYEKWIHYWVSEPDNGQSDAINKGLAHATGDVFNWLNSDDVYLPNALLAVGRSFLNKNINVLCGCEYSLYENGDKHLSKGSSICKTIEETIALGHIDQPPTFFRLDFYRQLGLLDNKLDFCMDVDMWVRYLCLFGTNGISKTEIVINLFRIHKESKTTNLKTISERDRLNILFSILKSLDKAYLPIAFDSKQLFFEFYSLKVYKIAANIDQKKLVLFITERFLGSFPQYFSWKFFFQLYFFALLNQSTIRNWRIYASPLIKIKRIFHL